MAWSDAAREASIEARRATAKTKAMPSVKSHPDGREGKIQDHKDAMKAHLKAAEINRAEGNATGAEHHEKMAAIHEEKAGAHEEKQTLGLQRQTLTVQKEMGREAKLRGEKPVKEDLTPGSRFASGKEADQLHQDRSMQRDKDDGARAAAATAHATAMTNEATTFRDAASHERAYAAHMAAAGANKVAGNKELVKSHEKMAERHEALEKSYKGGPVVERGENRGIPTPRESQVASQNRALEQSSHETTAMTPKGEARAQSAVAKGLTEKARASGKAEDHDKAAEAHSHAAAMHGRADRNNSELARTGQGRLPTSASGEHHDKMADRHEKAAADIRAQNAPKGVGKYWNS